MSPFPLTLLDVLKDFTLRLSNIQSDLQLALTDSLCLFSETYLEFYKISFQQFAVDLLKGSMAF